MSQSPRFVRTMIFGVPIAVTVLLSSLVFVALPALDIAWLTRPSRVPAASAQDTRDVPGDPTRFDPIAGLAEVLAWGGPEARLERIYISGVRRDGTLDVTADFSPTRDLLVGEQPITYQSWGVVVPTGRVQQVDMSSDASQREKFAVDLARRAGEMGLRYFRELDKLTIESKGHQDLVSEADRDVETFIRAALRDAYPDDGVIGEEHAPKKGTSGFDWVIDPIDGTANFVRGIPAWTVVIAGARDGATEVAVIHEPSTGETFHGHLGGGAFLNGRPIRTSPLTSLGEGSVGTGFSNRREVRNIVPFIDMLVSEGGVFYRNASGALMLAYVASGRLLAYVEEHMNAWDCLAGLLLVEEAGGRIVKPDPRTVLAQGTVVIAGCKGVFDRVEAMCAGAFSPR